MILAGFMAQLVDGALGMGYGLTSASILLSTGASVPAISGSIHTAEVFASGASGYSHYKFGNVNKKLFKALVIPGVIGAVAARSDWCSSRSGIVISIWRYLCKLVEAIAGLLYYFFGCKNYHHCTAKTATKEKL